MKKLFCPICSKETHWKRNPYRPFCSERCKLRDLASWIGEEYAIPGETVSSSPPDEDEEVKAGSSD